MSAFEEDHEKDMQDPEYARVWGETVKAIAREQRGYSLEECEHLNSDTTYEDGDIWQGMCRDCGAELEEYKDEAQAVEFIRVEPDDTDWTGLTAQQVREWNDDPL